MSPNPDAYQNPTYQEVCSGNSGHIEVFHMRFNPFLVRYKDLVRHFFTFHDPTIQDQQGSDKGQQYTSAIFYHDQK